MQRRHILDIVPMKFGDGENEITEGKAFIKNMETHEQTEVLLAEIESHFA